MLPCVGGWQDDDYPYRASLYHIDLGGGMYRVYVTINDGAVVIDEWQKDYASKPDCLNFNGESLAHVGVGPYGGTVEITAGHDTTSLACLPNVCPCCPNSPPSNPRPRSVIIPSGAFANDPGGASHNCETLLNGTQHTLAVATCAEWRKTRGGVTFMTLQLYRVDCDTCEWRFFIQLGAGLWEYRLTENHPIADCLEPKELTIHDVTEVVGLSCTINDPMAATVTIGGL